MPDEDPDLKHLWDMLTAARNVQAFVRSRTQAEYESDLLLRSAVERQVEIIGEAARRVSKSFQDARPEIPWRKITATRHILAHEYGRIDNKIMWLIATTYCLDLIKLIEPLAPDSAPEN